MSDKLHKILAELGDTINQEIIDAPAPALDLTDRSISGNKINGGKTFLYLLSCVDKKLCNAEIKLY